MVIVAVQRAAASPIGDWPNDWPNGPIAMVRGLDRRLSQSQENAIAGLSEDGRGGFRTCDLSRVKRALSH